MKILKFRKCQDERLSKFTWNTRICVTEEMADGKMISEIKNDEPSLEKLQREVEVPSNLN